MPDDDAAVGRSMMGPTQGPSSKSRVDLGGRVLKDSMATEARAKELLYFHSRGVWMKKPIATARARTGRPPITARCVDVNKGDGQTPKYRSRLVARRLKPTIRVARCTSHRHLRSRHCGQSCH